MTTRNSIALDEAFAHFNKDLFDGRLPPANITMRDAMEENASALFGQAKKLADLKVPCFMFQEGADPEVRGVFEEIARMTRGAFAPFASNSAKQLGELLKAVASFARGGIAALTADKSPSATLLLTQLRR